MRLTTLLVLLINAIQVLGQCPVNWQETTLQPEELESIVTNFQLSIEKEDFDSAKRVLLTLEKALPHADTTYILKGDFYYWITKSNPNLAPDYWPMVIKMHEDWANNCGNHALIAIRKSYVAYRIGIPATWKRRKKKFQRQVLTTIDRLFLEAIEQNHLETPDYLILAYVSNLMYLKKYTDELSFDEFPDRLEDIRLLIQEIIVEYPQREPVLADYRDRFDALISGEKWYYAR